MAAAAWGLRGRDEVRARALGYLAAAQGLWGLSLQYRDRVGDAKAFDFVLISDAEWTCKLPAANRAKCKDDVFDSWSLYHMALYAGLGYVAPELSSLEIIALSLAVELYEDSRGLRAKYVTDPISNYTGFLLGQKLSAHW